MKKTFLIALCVFISTIAAADIFEGTLGTKKIRASFKVDQGQIVDGAYFYIGRDATLAITNDDTHKPPRLAEADPLTFDVSGYLQLSLKDGHVDGSWIHPKTGKTTAVKLAMVTDEPIENPPLKAWKESWGRVGKANAKPCSIDTKTLDDSTVQSYGNEFASAFKKVQQKVIHDNEDESCSNPEPNSTFSVTCEPLALVLKKRFVSMSWDCSGENATDGTPTGAHPANGRYVFVFDLQTKKQLSIDDIVHGPLKFMDNPGAADFFLSPLGATFFFPNAGNAGYASSTTAPYSKLSETLKRIGKPQPLAKEMEF